MKDVLSVNHEPVSNTISDHNIVQLDIQFGDNNNIQTGPGYWILRDPNFQEDFENLWESLDSVLEQDSNWWENCKIQFRQLIISHSMRISRISHLALTEAKTDLTNLIRREENVGTTSELQNQIKEAQCLIDKLNENFLGAKIRSKVKYFETKEKPTSFFLHKEKKSAKDKHIKSLKNYDGEVINTSSEITEQCRHFYETLYSRKVVDESLDEYFLKDIPCLSEDSCTKFEGHITLEEYKSTLELMQNHKSPGPDGLPKEFYTFAFPYIGRSFVKLLNSLWKEGTLPLLQRGRSTILKAVLCSSIWYVGSLILMPENVRRTFLWKNQPEAIKRETLFNEFPKGGLNIVDIQTKLESLLVKQVLQLIKGTKAKWTYLAVYWIGLHLKHFVPSFASLDIPHSENILGYYK